MCLGDVEFVEEGLLEGLGVVEGVLVAEHEHGGEEERGETDFAVAVWFGLERTHVGVVR